MTDIQTKWGEAVAGRGFSQTPNYLLLLNQFLDPEHRLSPVELLVLIQLVGTWWKKGDRPFPSIGTLATRCGVSDRQIQRAISQLETLGLLKREKRRAHGIIASNAYDLEPLVHFLTQVAKVYPNEFPRNVSRAPRPSQTGESGGKLPLRFSTPGGAKRSPRSSRQLPDKSGS